MFYANYHTHTTRCRHAVGTEEEMAESAIKAGIKILGFSDHSPQAFEHEFVSKIRMLPKDAPDYVNKIKSVGEKYKSDLKVLVGFEAEYFPRIFGGLFNLCAENDVDYMILGQHFIPYPDGLSYEYIGMGKPVHTLKSYVDAAIDGLCTGCFSYIAHPDLYSPEAIESDGEFEKQYTRLCECAKETETPLEINKLGFTDGRWYPSKKFFDIAKRVGNTVIMGVDAHSPEHFKKREIDECYEFMKSLGMKMTDEIDLRHPWRKK